MSAEAVFSAANLLAVAGWILLLVWPRHPRVMLAAGTVLPLLLSVLYLVLLAIHWRGSEGGFGSLRDVAQLFANPWVLLAGWVHYLAFDLFIGAWETRDAMRLGISRWLLAPCLALTFMFGPVGLLAYYALRATRVSIW